MIFRPTISCGTSLLTTAKSPFTQKWLLVLAPVVLRYRSIASPLLHCLLSLLWKQCNMSPLTCFSLIHSGGVHQSVGNRQNSTAGGRRDRIVHENQRHFCRQRLGILRPVQSKLLSAFTTEKVKLQTEFWPFFYLFFFYLLLIDFND